MPSTRSLSPGRILLTLTALLTTLGAFLADFNKTHIYNPLWLPHAKFHTGQTMSISAYNALFSLYLLWGSSPANSGASPLPQNQALGYELERLGLVVIVEAMYFVTMLAAGLFPETAGLDPPGDPKALPQLWIAVPFLSFIVVGWAFEGRRLKGLLAADAKEK